MNIKEIVDYILNDNNIVYNIVYNLLDYVLTKQQQKSRCYIIVSHLNIDDYNKLINLLENLGPSFDRLDYVGESESTQKTYSTIFNNSVNYFSKTLTGRDILSTEQKYNHNIRDIKHEHICIEYDRNTSSYKAKFAFQMYNRIDFDDMRRKLRLVKPIYEKFPKGVFTSERILKLPYEMLIWIKDNEEESRPILTELYKLENIKDVNIEDLYEQTKYNLSYNPPKFISKNGFGGIFGSKEVQNRILSYVDAISFEKQDKSIQK